MKTFVRSTKKEGIRISVREDGKELGRAHLYVLRNDLHDKPFGFMEDVFVEEASCDLGIDTMLVGAVIWQARERGCYKLIVTSCYSRLAMHKLYRQLGFREHGVEYRIDF
jgi:GNAT superfamily N-acetyltransferase